MGSLEFIWSLEFGCCNFIYHFPIGAKPWPATRQIYFMKTASENPVLWTGMKGVSAESRKKVNQMLKQA